MKTITLVLLVTLFGVINVFPQAGDAAYVEGWKFPIEWWFNPTIPDNFDTYIREVAEAKPVTDFDADEADFDAEWAKIPGNGYLIGKEGSRLGLTASDKGAADFTGSFKAIYDDSNIYIMLQYTDDDVTGLERVEIGWAPYFKVNTPRIVTEDGNVDNEITGAWYGRYQQLGAYKATFEKTGFFEAMVVVGGGGDEQPFGSINTDVKPELLINSLFIVDKTAIASNVVKQIITIGFDALTGEARPNFDIDFWKGLEDGKGISFDLKVVDMDADDELNDETEPKPLPAEYWWSSTSNEAYQSTAFSGFLKAGGLVGVSSFKAENNSVFQGVTLETVKLKKAANVTVYNTAGVQLISIKNASEINISNLNKGVYIIRANDQTMKFVR